MLKLIEDLYYGIRFGKIEDFENLIKKLARLDVVITKSNLEKLFDKQASTDFSRELNRDNPYHDLETDIEINPYRSPKPIEIPVNDLTSYLRGVKIIEKPPREVQIIGEYFKEDLAHHKFDGIWKPKVLYHERVKITIEKIPGSGTLYSTKVPRNIVNLFIRSLPSEN
ncbi:Uncharacterised protein [uncultured archaeon]|nr:Uncharacterised protein [uncultured archaeon]